MTIRFILNGEDVEVSVEADKRLVSILRENFSLIKTKSGCLSGACGACSVIFNGAVSPSCLIPAFRVQGGEIITLEGFSQTDEYQDIAAGFSGAGVENCGYCDAGKILAAELLLEKTARPEKEEFYAAFSGVRCRCTEPERLYAGILAAAEIRRRRIYGRSS
ncbi:MAG: 2Fe-2S iron-sulfur cluster binding domain-containing protein [Treponema sp.]|jgi:carbon-monoxide dehydrogenase small subunit|nr:2Fe-2S iron-sulfur cluster binding domain-containing protein [Treponema sp.]